MLRQQRHGGGDPTYRVEDAGSQQARHWRGIGTPDGPATLLVRARPADAEVVARAWGPGADWALDGIPDLLGEHDDASGFVAHHDLVAEAARRFTGWRVPRSRLVLESDRKSVV